MKSCTHPVVSSIYSSAGNLRHAVLSTASIQEALLCNGRIRHLTIAFLTGNPGGDLLNHLAGDNLTRLRADHAQPDRRLTRVIVARKDVISRHQRGRGAEIPSSRWAWCRRTASARQRGRKMNMPRITAGSSAAADRPQREPRRWGTPPRPRRGDFHRPRDREGLGGGLRSDRAEAFALADKGGVNSSCASCLVRRGGRHRQPKPAFGRDRSAGARGRDPQPSLTRRSSWTTRIFRYGAARAPHLDRRREPMQKTCVAPPRGQGGAARFSRPARLHRHRDACALQVHTGRRARIPRAVAHQRGGSSTRCRNPRCSSRC